MSATAAPAGAALSICALSVRFETPRGGMNAVDGIDLDLRPGEGRSALRASPDAAKA